MKKSLLATVLLLLSASLLHAQYNHPEKNMGYEQAYRLRLQGSSPAFINTNLKATLVWPTKPVRHNESERRA